MHSAPATNAIRPWRACPKSRRPARLATACATGLLLILTACASPTITVPPAAATGSAERHSVRALACDEIKIVHPHLGKITAAGADDVQKQDILDRLALPDW